MLDTANQYYNAPATPGESTLSRIGRSLGRTAMMVPNAISAAVTPASEAERNQGFTGAAQFGPLQAHRMAVAPSQAAADDVDHTALVNAAHGGHPSAAAIYGGHALASIPFLGPWALSEGKRASQGDLAGTLTDAAAMGGLPSIIKESMAGGALPGAVEAGRPSFPTLPAAGSAMVRGGATALERLTPHDVGNATGTAIGGVAGEVVGGHAKIPGVGPITGAGTGGYLGGKLGSGIAKIVSEDDRAPLVNMPGARALNRADLMTPQEAEWLQQQPEALARLQAEVSKPLKVAIPGGKERLYTDYVKTVKGPPAAAPEAPLDATVSRQDTAGPVPKTYTPEPGEAPTGSNPLADHMADPRNQAMGIMRDMSQELLSDQKPSRSPSIAEATDRLPNPYREGSGRTGATVAERTYRLPDGSLVKGSDLAPTGETVGGRPDYSIIRKDLGDMIGSAKSDLDPSRSAAASSADASATQSAVERASRTTSPTLEQAAHDSAIKDLGGLMRETTRNDISPSRSAAAAEPGEAGVRSATERATRTEPASAYGRKVGVKGESKASVEMQEKGAKGGEHEASLGQFAKVNGTKLESAIAESEGDNYGSQGKLRDALHGISQTNGDLGRVAKQLGVDIDDVGKGKYSESGTGKVRTRHEIFNRMLDDGNSPQDIVDAYTKVKGKKK